MSRSIHPDNTGNLARERERQARAQEQETYPPEPYWGADDRGRWRYVDYDGEQLVIRFEKDGDLWIDKLGEGPVYVRKQDIAAIIDALNGDAK